MSNLQAELSAPFPKIHWRAQNVVDNGTGPKAMALAYMDARDVMERLDSVMGIEGWKDSYQETPSGRIICTLSLRLTEGWVDKSDGAGDTAVEGEKGALSDALKRAAVKWGIGRYLYDLPAPWADCEVYHKGGKAMFKKWTASGLAKLEKVHPSYSTANDAPKQKPPFPKGIASGIDDLRKRARALWKEIDICGDEATLLGLIEGVPDNKALIEQMKQLTGSYAEVWSGNGGDNPGVNGLISRKMALFNQDFDVRGAENINAG